MEKKHKSYAMGMKRQRKTSLRGAASEPKNLKPEIPDIPAIELDNPLSTTKVDADITKSIVPETNKRSKKRKAKKASENIEDNETDQPKAKKSKKTKRHSDKIDKSSPVALHLKKKKKEKELMAEVHNLKVELGIEDTLKQETEGKPTETEAKGRHKSPVVKPVDLEEMSNKYPVLQDKELIKKFMKVPMNNNQKGRIRLAVRHSLQDSTAKVFPDIINGKIQAILSSSTDLTDSELRRVRILYNMLKTSLESPEELEEETKTPKKKKEKKKKEKGESGDKKESVEQKVKGPKRYVVFLGNLPLGITKEKIMDHFRELNEQIVDIRLPKREPGHKSAIAYVELSNEPSYELALSKHHSMLGSKRIRVLYTTQKNSKISKAEAKGKSAKLIALQKAGKLVGSVATSKKRSHRRNIMKKAKAKEAAAAAATA